MFNRWSLVVIFLVFGALSIAKAHAETLTVGSETIEFDPGKGICSLKPRSYDYDRLLFEWQQKSNKGINEILGMYIDCSRLSRLRSGEDTEMGQYGILLAPYDKGLLKKLPQISRARFLQQISKALKKGIDIRASDIENRLNEALNPAMKAKIGKIEMPILRLLGVLFEDEVAIYSGLLVNVKSTKTSPDWMSAVLSITLVKGHAIQYSLYKEFVDQMTYTQLIDDLKPVMRKFVTGNESFESRLSGSPQAASTPIRGFDWGRVVGKAIVGAIIGALFGSIIWFFRRKRDSN